MQLKPPTQTTFFKIPAQNQIWNAKKPSKKRHIGGRVKVLEIASDGEDEESTVSHAGSGMDASHREVTIGANIRQFT